MQRNYTRVLLILLLINYSFGEDLGVIAKVYSISEPDMIEWIKNKAKIMIQNGGWQQIQNQAIVNARKQINNPKPVEGITDAKVTKVWYYKPLITVRKDLTDGSGHIIAKSGTYNALKFKPMDEQLLFINGENLNQVRWAINHVKHDEILSKIILTKGSFLKLDKQYKIWFYYDQNGKYTSRLKITHVPAIVSQENDQLKIMEISNKEI